MITAFGWAVLHALWQGAAIGGAWWWLARHDAPQGRYRTAGAALGILTMLFVATAAVFSRPNGVQSRVHDTVDSIGSGAVAELLRVSPGAAPLTALVTLVGWCWALGAGLVLARYAGGWWMAHRTYVGGARPTRPDWSAAAARVAARLGMAEAPRILETAGIDSPAVVGLRAPAVVLPSHGLEHLAADQLEAVLAHELAHIRRRDGVANALQCAANAILFFHPIVRVLSHRLSGDREKLCDRMAVACCGDARTYIAGLLTLEESRHRSERFALAARGGELLERVRAVLATDDEGIGRTPLRAAFAGAALLALGALLTIPGSLDLAVASGAPDRYTIAALDPAGAFSVTVARGRAVAATVGGIDVPPSGLIHLADSLFVVPPHGTPAFALHLEASGGIRWTPRPPHHR